MSKWVAWFWGFSVGTGTAGLVNVFAYTHQWQDAVTPAILVIMGVSGMFHRGNQPDKAEPPPQPL